MKQIRRFISALLCLCFVASAACADGLLKVGCEGESTLNLQDRLVELGFSQSIPDGKYGNATKQSVLDFQKAANSAGFNISVDGVAGEQTLGLIYDDQKMESFLCFGINEKSLRTARLQTRLYDLNFIAERPDGYFGPNTQNALRAFQRHAKKHGADIDVSGKRDLKTKNLLSSKDLSLLSIEAPEFFDDAKPLELNESYIASRACILVDLSSGETLFEKNAGKKMYPASTTKVMTLLIALESADIDKQITIPKEASDVPKDSSLVPVYPNEKMSFRDLLYGLMIRSGNDAANALAVICSGSIESFVEKMNSRAKKIGMKNTHFSNPHGYHDDMHYTTCEDLSLLTIEALKNQDFFNIAKATSYNMPATKKRGELEISTKSSILLPESPYFYPYAIGIKSGFTKPAANCYIGMALKDGRCLLAVVLDCRTRPKMWTDLKRLFEYGFALSSK
ncbi:MAG: peptidoglycan-binding protein [Christensenellales bacterium]